MMDKASASGAEAPDGPLGAMPLMFLWMNTGCNARCPMCDIWRNQGKTRLRAPDIGRWAPQWRRFGLADVQLCGEATLHPELEEVATALAASGIAVHLLTNGLTLADHGAWLAPLCDSLTVSLDGPPEVHDRVRGVREAYARLARGVACVRAGRPMMPIHGRCAVHRLNHRHLCETVETARTLGLTSISFLPLDVSSLAFGREQLGPGAQALEGARALLPTIGEVRELAEEIARLTRAFPRDFERPFIRETPDTLDRILVEYYTRLAAGARGQAEAPRCNAPWTSVVLEPDGAVRPCFFLPAYGTLPTDGLLEDVINSPLARQFRAALDIATDPTCRSCICPHYIDPSTRAHSEDGENWPR